MSRITMIIIGGEKIKGLGDAEGDYWVSWSQWIHAATNITPRSARINLDFYWAQFSRYFLWIFYIRLSIFALRTEICIYSNKILIVTESIFMRSPWTRYFSRHFRSLAVEGLLQEYL